jgi:hypothetical protein
VSTFQHHTKLCSKCSTLLVSSLNLIPVCWWKVTRTFNKSRYIFRPICLPSSREVLRKMANLVILVILYERERTLISGFRRDADEICSLLCYYTTPCNNPEDHKFRERTLSIRFLPLSLQRKQSNKLWIKIGATSRPNFVKIFSTVSSKSLSRLYFPPPFLMKERRKYQNWRVYI